jgi:predicted amidohydrolase YtcJ
MPGLIDAHTHLMFATIPQQALLVGGIYRRRARSRALELHLPGA